MTTNAGIGYGIVLKVGDGGSPTELFTDMGLEITSLTPPGYTRDALDATHSASPDRFKEYIAGMMDAGEVSMDLNWVPSATDAVIAALEAGKQNYQILIPSEITITFSGICTAYSPAAPIPDKMTASATFKVSGKPVLAAV